MHSVVSQCNLRASASTHKVYANPRDVFVHVRVMASACVTPYWAVSSGRSLAVSLTSWAGAFEPG